MHIKVQFPANNFAFFFTLRLCFVPIITTCTNKSYFTFKKIIQDKFSDKFTAVTLIWLVNTFPQKLVYDHYTSMAPDEQVGP